MPRILIIEEDAIVLRIFQNILVKNLGAEVLTSIDAEEGLRKSRGEKIDLILIDMFLNNQTTLGVLETLKNNPTTSEIPVIVISVIGDKDNINTAKTLGVKEFIIKGEVSTKDALNTIKKALNKI